MSTGILESIDGALRDWGTSNDAMRWVPESDRDPERAPRPDPGGNTLVRVTVDTEEFARSLNEFAAAMERALRPVVEDTVRHFHALSAALFPFQHLFCSTCRPARKPKPLAVNGHEYRRRQRARVRRKR